MQATVLLFDIDGTLVLTGGAGRRAMAAAFSSLHGRDDVFEGLSFGGMTDRAIVRHGLQAAARGHSASFAESEIDRVLDSYLAFLQEELAITPDYRVLPGVTKLLDSLIAMPDLAIGLGTGNVRRGAYAKLERGALHSTFAFGGFGCDAEDRTALLRAGAERGAAQLGASMTECRFVVIGDTPKDVAAAKGIGARCIGVGTGSFTMEALLACGAERAFATLADDGAHAALFED